MEKLHFTQNSGLDTKYGRGLGMGNRVLFVSDWLIRSGNKHTDWLKYLAKLHRYAVFDSKCRKQWPGSFRPTNLIIVKQTCPFFLFYNMKLNWKIVIIITLDAAF